jgi:hypothetical protein
MKKILFLLSAALLFVYGCSDDDSDNPVAASGEPL